jgi:hypothetical protein
MLTVNPWFLSRSLKRLSIKYPLTKMNKLRNINGPQDIMLVGINNMNAAFTKCGTVR